MIDDTALLNEAHRQFLRARGVADDVATERGYRSATRKAELEKLDFGRLQQLVPALVIPVWVVRVKVECYRLRPGDRLSDFVPLFASPAIRPRRKGGRNV
jgi:hypothetical protein